MVGEDDGDGGDTDGGSADDDGTTELPEPPERRDDRGPCTDRCSGDHSPGVYDCNYYCAPLSWAVTYTGDGICDDASWDGVLRVRV